MEIINGAWTLVDGVLLLGILLYSFQAYEHGVVAVVNEMIAWLLAWWLGLAGFQAITSFLVINLGLKASNIRPWSLLLTVLVAQICFYRGLEYLTGKMPRHYFSRATHVVLGSVPALICGICFTSYVLLVLIALPFKFPFKADLISSRAGAQILGALPMLPTR